MIAFALFIDCKYRNKNTFAHRGVGKRDPLPSRYGNRARIKMVEEHALQQFQESGRQSRAGIL